MMRPMTFEDDREMAVAPGTSGVMAAMSGGVDSSVCALLLQEAGYAVRSTIVAPRTSKPASCKSSAHTELSTPPDIAAITLAASGVAAVPLSFPKVMRRIIAQRAPARFPSFLCLSSSRRNSAIRARWQTC